MGIHLWDIPKKSFKLSEYYRVIIFSDTGTQWSSTNRRIVGHSLIRGVCGCHGNYQDLHLATLLSTLFIA